MHHQLLVELRYSDTVKPIPQGEEFTRFTTAMRKILKVSKVELQKRLDAEKRKPKAYASPVSVVSSKTAN
jgi:hypothetical protein